MLSDEDLTDLCVLESDTHLEGIKRFSDFSKFHDLLLSSVLGIYVKGEKALLLPSPATSLLIVHDSKRHGQGDVLW